MDTPQLDAFVAVVEIGSFTRAAARLNLSQPTVTTRVKSLEHGLGVSLLERLPSGVRPTPAGVQLLPYAREIISLTARARQAISSDGEPHGCVEVGTVESVTSYRLLPMVEYLYRRYPKMQVSLHAGADADAITAVRDGRLDCAFVVGSPEEHEGLETQVLCPEPLVLVGSPSHSLVGRGQVADADLRNTPIIRADSRAGYHNQFEEALGPRGEADRPRVFELDSVDAAKRSVALGIGMALMPLVAVERELGEGALAAIDWVPPFETFTQVVRRKANVSHAALSALVAAALDVAAEPMDPLVLAAS
ncbi:HTH-type transcriptional regulator YofA [Streptomyces sp. ADI96-02]|uniref:LysR family transcriptional regulator n=1 Tax=unclassified Streptomyces TaxID=2593676 RepID=UPI000F54D20E|nr:LysR family transcriptional regulator [Streptomyces sp. ADI96-02]RPK65808.1 HTH-type transcriptional regulator YofA [Streptomyces sp. ADI96-02]